jgi:phosphatidylglycerol lysyltransferase
MSDADRVRLLALLQRHGWNATSFQVLEQGFRYWFEGEDACVAYVDTGRAWVAAGAPITSPARLPEVSQAFVKAAAAEGRRASFFAVEKRFQVPGIELLLVGEQPVWDPLVWAETVRESRGLRQQLRRARAKGVAVRALPATALAEPSLRTSLERLMARWLGSRALAPMSFLVDVQPFSFPDERRYFLAESDAGAVVGLLVAVPVYARNGWLFEDLLRDPDAPNGSAELLIDAAMSALAAEGSRYVTLGLAPLAGAVSGVLGLARDLSAGLYDFRGVYTFRAKLRPAGWDPIHLGFPTGRLPAVLASSRAVLDALVAFAGGGLTGFGFETLLRGPAFVVRALALLLVPWTVLLALVSPRHFPFPAAQWLWVAFDLLLVGALSALASRWRRGLALAMASAVTADAVVTWTQVVLYNVPRARGGLDWLALVLGTLAPSLASVILWRALGHRRRAALDPA